MKNRPAICIISIIVLLLAFSQTLVFAQTAVSPADGDVLTERRPEFAWQGEEGATWYHLWINRNNDKYHSEWIEGNTVWPPDFDFKSGDYKWWVGAWGAGAYLGWDGPYEYSISNMVPAKVDLLEPEDSIETNRPAFAWSGDEYAEWCQLWIQKDGSRYYTEWMKGETNCVPDRTFPMGEYKWWVQAWSPDGSIWSDSASFTYGLSTPLNPTGTVEVARPAYEWSQVADAEWYQIVVQRNGSSYDKKWIQNDGNWTFDYDLPYGGYEWWVRTWNSSGMGPWSSAEQFYIGRPEAIAPSGDLEGPPTELRWNDSQTTDATWYQVLVVRRGGGYAFDWFEQTKTAEEGEERTIQYSETSLPELSGGAYWWVIRAWKPEKKTGPWSKIMEFSVP